MVPSCCPGLAGRVRLGSLEMASAPLQVGQGVGVGEELLEKPRHTPLPRPWGCPAPAPVPVPAHPPPPPCWGRAWPSGGREATAPVAERLPTSRRSFQKPYQGKKDVSRKMEISGWRRTSQKATDPTLQLPNNEIDEEGADPLGLLRPADPVIILGQRNSSYASNASPTTQKRLAF